MHSFFFRIALEAVQTIVARVLTPTAHTGVNAERARFQIRHNHSPSACCWSILHQRCFLLVGAVVLRGLLGQSHVPPLVSASLRHPAALRLAPSSMSKMYVMILRYPSSRATRAARPYKKEQTFGVPSVQSRTTSIVAPSSSIRDTGLASWTTPTNRSPSYAATRSLSR